MESQVSPDAYLKRLEWIAIILLAINTLMMVYTYALFMDDETWGQIVVALHTAVAVVLLLSVVFSVFGRASLSRVALATGILVLIVAIIALGIRLMDLISDYGGYY